jgi:hypothetical protein
MVLRRPKAWPARTRRGGGGLCMGCGQHRRGVDGESLFSLAGDLRVLRRKLSLDIALHWVSLEVADRLQIRGAEKIGVGKSAPTVR